MVIDACPRGSLAYPLLHGRAGMVALLVLTRRRLTALAALIALVCLGSAPGEGAVLNAVTSGTASLPNSATATQVSLPGLDITKAFVLCSTRTANTSGDEGLFTCDLNVSGGTSRLTITPSFAPGNTTTRVQYYVAEFDAGVSVQRGIATFTGTSLTPTAAPTLTAVDCAKSFVLTSVRSTDASAARDEIWTVRAILGTGASPCTSGTTTSLELTRNDGQSGETVTVAWQVVTFEGASVQRGTSCIGGSSAAPACALASGGTNGLTNRVTLGTAVDTSKSFILVTGKAGTSVAGVEGEYNVRAEFLASGTSVTGVQFSRVVTTTSNNHQVDLAWQVVSLSDGSTVQNGTTSLSGTSTSATVNITTVDTTRTALFFVNSAGDSGSTGRLDDVSLTGTINGSNGGSASSISFTRLGNSNIGTVAAAWFAVSFFRCNTSSGVSSDTLCAVAASAAGTTATVNWSSVNPVIVVGGVTPVTVTPTNGTTYTSGQSLGGFLVAYSGTLASESSFSVGGLIVDTTYYYKVWAKAGPVGSCSTPPCYIGGATGTVTPRGGAVQWTSITVGGAALNPAVAGTGRLSFGTNAGKLLSVSSSTGAWSSVPGNTLGAVQGYVSVFPFGAGESVVAADQSGWVYSVNPATGTTNWTVKLNADAVQSAVSTYLRPFFSSAMTAVYPGTYDIVFVATMNNTASGGFTNNKVFALRSDTGAVLWTFSPATLATSPCATGCPMDQILGQPWVDYARDRLYVTSRDGSGNNQNGIWIVSIVANGALLARYAGGDFTTAPSVLFDNTKLLVGDEAGVLHIVDLATLVKTTNTVASGSAFKGFVWEDFNIPGRLYFVTSDGNVWALATPSSASAAWKTKPVSGGTVAQLLPGNNVLWVGGSNGRLYQLDLTSGAVAKTLTIGSGTLSVGPVSTETTGELYVGTTDGTLYKVGLTAESLP
jgi:hypothetical protein